MPSASSGCGGSLSGVASTSSGRRTSEVVMPISGGRVIARNRVTNGSVVAPEAPHRDLRPQPRAAARRALELERAVERGDPVLEPAQARAAARVGPADAVVGDLDGD